MAFLAGDTADTGRPGIGLKAMLARRLTEIWGLALLGVGTALGLALVSYDATDPS